MADNMVREIEVGIGDSGVRCGVIGEIGCSYPLKDSEKRALQAAAMAQTRTGDLRPLLIPTCMYTSIFFNREVYTIYIHQNKPPLLPSVKDQERGRGWWWWGYCLLCSRPKL